MRRYTFIFGIFLLVHLSSVCDAQTGSDGDQNPFRLHMSVDEVILTFHAADINGLPINDLKLPEMKLLDNGKLPARVLTFDTLQDAPIRAAILLDTSESMQDKLFLNKSIAQRFAVRIFRQQTDKGLVMDFGYGSEIAQTWTNSPSELANSIQSARQGRMNPLGGTALFDTIFRACYYGLSKIDHTESGNFILLFSDGEDNASHLSSVEALEACQHSNTAIYAFRTHSNIGRPSTGPATLAELASKSGGRVFFADGSEELIANDLRVIESETRNQYRLVYRPADFKHDGSFHSIELQPPDRVHWLEVRTGYYAATH